MTAPFPTAGPTGRPPSVDTAILEFIDERGITEVLHFTTAPNALVGICATGAVRSRARLDTDDYVEHIYRPNTYSRINDIDWVHYVNLSISRINFRMLRFSEKQHAAEDVWWAVLSFRPEVLAHPGVYFGTTNNIYQATVRRAAGLAGLVDLFADRVPWGHYGSVSSRWNKMPSMWTTDNQAEALYPGELPLSYLQTVYVREPEQEDDVNAWIGLAVDVSTVPVITRPEVFG